MLDNTKIKKLEQEIKVLEDKRNELQDEYLKDFAASLKGMYIRATRSILTSIGDIRVESNFCHVENSYKNLGGIRITAKMFISIVPIQDQEDSITIDVGMHTERTYSADHIEIISKEEFNSIRDQTIRRIQE